MADRFVTVDLSNHSDQSQHCKQLPSELKAGTCHRCQARENEREQVVTGFILFLIIWESGASLLNNHRA